MASIEKRVGKNGTAYRVAIKRVGHDTIYNTLPSKAEAKVWASIREAELSNNPNVSPVIKGKTVADAIDRYVTDVCPTHKSKSELRALDYMKRTLPFAGRLMSEVTKDDVTTWRDTMPRSAWHGVGKEIKSSTKLRYFAKLRCVFKVALLEWQWIRVTPFADIKPPAHCKPRSAGWSDSDIRALCLALGYRRGQKPQTQRQQLAIAFLIAIQTAMRKGEIFGLQAGQVDLASRIVTLRDGETKTDEGRQVALTTEAVALFKLVMPTGNRPDARLFNVNVKSTVNEFRAGCKAAGLGDVRFHDARRESATRLSKHMNVMELAAQTGHSNINTLYRVYYKKNATARAAKLAKIAI